MMTPRERWLAAIRMQPVDRLPFWPKLVGTYLGPRRAPFSEMTLEEIHDWIGSDKHTGLGLPLRTIRRRTSIETTRDSQTSTTLYKTPHGTLTAGSQYAPMSYCWHPMRYPVRTVGDLRILRECFDDAETELDRDALDTIRARRREIGENAVTHSTIGTSALMWWVQSGADYETAQVLLHEHPGEVEELFDSMHRVLRRRVELACEYAPVDLLYLNENTSTTLISPAQYRRLNLPRLQEYARMACQAGRLLVLHMCGHLKALLPDLAQLPVAAFETFTSPPVGNTRLIDGRTACPNTCLIGGTNATQWIRGADVLIAELERDLDDLPHHRGLVVTSSAAMPPATEPETIKAVCEWVKSYQPSLAVA